MKKIIVFSIMALFWACQSESDIANPYELVKPDYFPDPTYDEIRFPVTKEGFELGKKLFKDPILSRDGSISCQSCHVQSFAFADPHTLSIGIEERAGIRNAPPLQNLAYKNHFFWDGGVTHLDFTSLNAIENPLEMDQSMVDLVEKLKTIPEYEKSFHEVYEAEISAPLILKALAQFMAKLESTNSRYDAYLRGDIQLTELEKRGADLFNTKCGSCHSGALFTDEQFHNNGLDSVFSDKGFGLISENPADDGTFRTPSLRNIALTAPYMHDGRLKTLDAVLEHYTTGVKDSQTLDPLLKQNETLGIPMDVAEKEAIKAFLQTLTDREFVQNKFFR